MPHGETIVAVSTPGGRAPRGVVRLSGPDALRCAAARFHPAQDGDGWQRTFRATPGELALVADGISVPALAYVMRAPRSYTREDVVEFHLPGAPALLEMVLDDILEGEAGSLRAAEPGEFTRRAFLNGRIDLAEAEAVLALIRSRSEAELLAAAGKLAGRVGRRCAALQEQLTGLRVEAEAALDFAPHGIELIAEGEFLERCEGLRQEMAAEVAAGRGELAADGAVHAVICGPPNAGKSSLLNRLAGSDAALVHHRAGTTRDAVGAEVEVGGVFFRITDTAGLNDAAAGPDAEAVRRAADQARACQLLMLVLDGSELAPEGAADVAAALPRERVLCVINKCDLPQALDEAALEAGRSAWETVRTSALTGEGLDALREALGRAVAEGRLDASAADCLLNARQRDAVRRALAEVEAAAEAVRQGLGYEFAAVNLRAASDAIGEVTGELTSQDVLDRLFSTFCIGK
jgi:tRNA modification GTPase